MKLILQHANLRATDRLDRWIEECLVGLLPLIRIEEARVRLEYQPSGSPAYRAVAHLVIPGPDLRVEAFDHTPRSAFDKVMGQLKAGAIHRAARRLRRHLLASRIPALLRRESPGRSRPPGSA